MTARQARRIYGLTGRLVTWATVGGLGVVLGLFAAIAVVGALSGDHAAEHVRRSGI